MIIHIVLFKLKKRSEVNIKECLELLRGLMGKVPALKALTVGEDVVQAERSYDVGIIAGFEDMAGLESYRSHPEHVSVAKRLNELSSSIVALDFEEKGSE
ncbi:MAG: Dabb family protein [Thermodesulfobacteriota bacterium]